MTTLLQPPYPTVTTIGTNQKLGLLSHPGPSEGFARIMNSLAGDEENNLIYNPLGNLQFVPLRKSVLWKSLVMERLCG